MNNEEAKFLLHAYRPSGQDSGDAAMIEALEQARTDPMLGAWFGREQALGAVVSTKLQSISPPAGLREAILAGARASSASSRRHTWHLPRWLAVAALVLLAGLSWWNFAPVPGDTLDEYALNVVTRRFFLRERSPDVSELKAWLAARHAPVPGALPSEFAQLRALGCRTLEFNGRDVSLVCFERDGKEFHVFVARRSDLPPSLAPQDRPLFERKDHVVAAWSDTENHYVLVSDASRATVEQLL